jgi:hypothetical protein
MRKALSLFLLAWVGMLLLGPAYGGETVVLYRQVFGLEKEKVTSLDGGETALNIMAGAVGWEEYAGAEGVRQKVYSIGGARGQPEDLGNVNSTVQERSQSNGFAHFGLDQDGTVHLAILTEAEAVAAQGADLDPAHYESLTFQWRGGSNIDKRLAGMGQRVAVQIGGGWFVSDEIFRNNLKWKGFAEMAQTFQVQFKTDGASWHDLQFDPGAVLKAVDTARTEPLPAGAITNFGIFTETEAKGTAFLDTFEVIGVKK